MTTFAAKVWKTLSTLDVNEHTEKKVNLTYLSWAWAWQTLLNAFPESTIDSVEEKVRPDGTVTVYTTVTVREGEHAITRTMWLPVMDNRNNAVVNPDARKISDATMRCLTKCLGMFGLGLYIYAGEDLPQEDANKWDELRAEWSKRIADCESAAMVNSLIADLAKVQAPENVKHEIKALLNQTAKHLDLEWDKEQKQFTEKAA